MTMVKNEDFKIIKGEKKLTLYQFHTKVAKHFFARIAVSILTIILGQIHQ